MPYLLAAACAVAALLVGVPLLRRGHRPNEVDRFHVARSLTTTWSSEPQPDFHVPASGEQVDGD